MPNNTEIADILEKAADLYESDEYDWGRGFYVRRGGSSHSGLTICAAGALGLASGAFCIEDNSISAPRVLNVKTENASLHQLAVALGFVFIAEVVTWNDFIATKQDVIDRFKDTAKNYRNKA